MGLRSKLRPSGGLQKSTPRQAAQPFNDCGTAGNGRSRNFSTCFNGRTVAQTALISTEELSTRYWVPFLTPHDHIPLHSTHVYIAFFFAHQPQKRTKTRAEAARALERPSHSTRPTVPCAGRGVRKASTWRRAWAATLSHTRPPARRTSAELTRRSPHAAGAENRRCVAPVHEPLALPAAERSAWMVCVAPLSSRCCRRAPRPCTTGTCPYTGIRAIGR